MAVRVVPDTLTEIGSLPVTNSLFTAWLVVALFVALGLALRTRAATVPRGLQNAAEAAVEGILSFMDQVTRDRARSRRFLPFVGTLFPFILVTNWLGLLPGVGSFTWNGHALLRPATSDLNMTLALGITSVVVSHIIGITTIGFFKHWSKFIQIGGLVKAVRGFGKKPLGEAAIGIFTALIDIAVGFLELISEAAKMLSLSLRLFGNIFAGEVLLHVLATISAFLLPTPFLFMELIVGVVQALVFSILTLVYLTLATEPPHGDHDERHEEKHAPAHA
jgi:F-type H+-transporting ATPase subunit a